MAKLSEKAYELREKYEQKYGKNPRGWCHGEETMKEYEQYLENALKGKEAKMNEIEKIGEFNLYDRVRIKGTEITGNIVFIYDDVDCEIEYDAQYDTKEQGIYTHNVNELEKE